MAKEKLKSVRELARHLGISHTTVSDALRNNPRVSERTRERVQQAAKACGYDYNPLAGAIMSEIRRSTVGAFRGLVAIIDLESMQARSAGAAAYHAEILRGARAAADRLGFKADLINLGEEELSVSRLNGIIETRGIKGVLVLPAVNAPSLSQLNWDNLAGIYTDYLIDDPPLHIVCPDHFRSMIVALHQVTRRGYRCPGLVLKEEHDRRLHFRWQAAFNAYVGHHIEMEVPPPLLTKNLSRRVFEDWFNATTPDVVICHHGEVLKWMEWMGCEVPETHGFCCLNITSGEAGASGLDLQPALAGQRAMESLVAQIQRNEFGIPRFPSTVTYSAVWQDGPTLRFID